MYEPVRDTNGDPPAPAMTFAYLMCIICRVLILITVIVLLVVLFVNLGTAEDDIRKLERMVRKLSKPDPWSTFPLWNAQLRDDGNALCAANVSATLFLADQTDALVAFRLAATAEWEPACTPSTLFFPSSPLPSAWQSQFAGCAGGGISLSVSATPPPPGWFTIGSVAASGNVLVESTGPMLFPAAGSPGSLVLTGALVCSPATSAH